MLASGSVGAGRYLGAGLGGEAPDAVPEPGDRGCEGREVVGLEPDQNAGEEVVAEQVQLLEEVATEIGQRNDDDPSVVGDPDPLDEPALRHPIDEAGRIREADVEELGKAAHRQAAVSLEERHGMEVAHADPESAEPLTAEAL